MLQSEDADRYSPPAPGQEDLPIRTLATVATFGFGADTARLLRAFRALGCATCQFYREDGAPVALDFARRTAASAGLRFDSVHGAFGEHIDPSSPDPAERARCLALYEEEGRLALDLGGPAVVVHPACFNADRRVMAPGEADAAQEHRWPALEDFLPRLADIGQRLGVTYLIENQPRNCPLGHDPAGLADRVRQVGASHVRMCFDTGHAHLTGDVADAIRACADVIDYLHVHDNDGSSDQHLMPGDGSIPLSGRRGVAEALRECGVAAPRMLEVFYTPEQLEQFAAGDLPQRLRTLLALGDDRL
jgi:sugar phosphate isomerase/epimerase